MAGLVKKILIGASVVAGMTTVAGAPALAQWTVEGDDVIKYEAVDTDSDGIVDTTEANPGADVNDILNKMDGTPGGNIELFATSEVNNAAWGDWKYNSDFWFGTGGASITGEVNGKSLTLSSLNAFDWFGSDGYTEYGDDDIANQWIDELLNKYQPGLGKKSREFAFYTFAGMYGFERASDPNISYIDSGSDGIEIGLAGHLDLGDVYGTMFEGMQASEVVKVEYDGVVDYLWSFSAVDSGLTAKDDGTSHNGLYKVTVPEPSTMLGLMAVGGLFAASKRKSAKNS